MEETHKCTRGDFKLEVPIEAKAILARNLARKRFFQRQKIKNGEAERSQEESKKQLRGRFITTLRDIKQTKHKKVF